jgi:hypothetical protein
MTRLAAVIVVAFLTFVLCAPLARAAGGTLIVSVPGSATVGTATDISVTGSASQTEALYIYVTDVDASCPATPSGVFDGGVAEGFGNATLADDVPVGQGPVSEDYSYTPSQAASFLVCGYLDTNEDDTPDADSSAPFVVLNPAPQPSPTPPVTKPTPTPPVKLNKLKSTGAPTVSGRLVVGDALTATPGKWVGTRPIFYAYQWQRCIPKCSAIVRATRSSYKIPSRDTGAQFRVVVTATNAAGSTKRSSTTTFQALDAVCGRVPCLLDEAHSGFIYKPPLILLNRQATEVLVGLRIPPSGRSIPTTDQLHWIVWNSTRAIATGYFWKNSCVPSCRRGTYERFAAVVTATQPHNNIFTRLGIVYLTSRGYVRLTAPIERSGTLSVQTLEQPSMACPASFYTGVNGHLILPSCGHGFSPLVAIESPH